MLICFALLRQRTVAHEISCLPAQVEGIAKARLLALLRGQSLHWLQVEVVVQVKVVQILAVNQEIQHVVPLPAHLRVLQAQHTAQYMRIL